MAPSDKRRALSRGSGISAHQARRAQRLEMTSAQTRHAAHAREINAAACKRALICTAALAAHHIAAAAREKSKHGARRFTRMQRVATSSRRAPRMLAKHREEEKQTASSCASSSGARRGVTRGAEAHSYSAGVTSNQMAASAFARTLA